MEWHTQSYNPVFQGGWVGRPEGVVNDEDASIPALHSFGRVKKLAKGLLFPRDNDIVLKEKMGPGKSAKKITKHRTNARTRPPNPEPAPTSLALGQSSPTFALHFLLFFAFAAMYCTVYESCVPLSVHPCILYRCVSELQHVWDEVSPIQRRCTHEMSFTTARRFFPRAKNNQCYPQQRRA